MSQKARDRETLYEVEEVRSPGWLRRFFSQEHRARNLARANTAAALTVGSFVFLASWINNAWFLEPSGQLGDHADAALVFAGGRGERLETGIALAEAGRVDVLVVNRGGDFDSRSGGVVAEFCDNPPPHLEIVCLVAEPDNTRGEAQSFSRLANEQEWESVVVVSTDHHLVRAAIHVRRCFDGRVDSVPGEAPSSAKQIRHEWLGVIHSLVIDRSC